MVVLDERRPTAPTLGGRGASDALDAQDEARMRRAVLTGAGAFAVILVGFWAWWPAGVVLGLVAGSLAVLRIGRSMAASALAEPAVGLAALAGEEDLRDDFQRLRSRLGDDWPAFRRAALLVTHAQWASVAGLQRELRVSTASAQHLMGQLEREGFVGPSRGTRARVVRLGRDRAADLEAFMHL